MIGIALSATARNPSANGANGKYEQALASQLGSSEVSNQMPENKASGNVMMFIIV